jgi:hypothetical protein
MSLVDLAYVTALIVVLGVPGVVTALKGHYALALIGLVALGLVWLVAFLRLARPNSWWARNMYGESKLARAQRRYGV